MLGGLSDSIISSHKRPAWCCPVNSFPPSLAAYFLPNPYPPYPPFQDLQVYSIDLLVWTLIFTSCSLKKILSSDLLLDPISLALYPFQFNSLPISIWRKVIPMIV
jgi:hypothetical protein